MRIVFAYTIFTFLLIITIIGCKRKVKTDTVSAERNLIENYVPPIGIPAPEFGIEETVEILYGSDSFYTHFVDNAQSDATDDGNPFGSADKPRLTIPSVLAAGSVVEIHGGPYTGMSATYLMNGTVDKPVFIRGVSDTGRPVIRQSVFRFDGQYFIVENLDFYDKSLIRFNTTSKYGSLRNSEVHNPVGAIGATNPTVSVTGEQIVVYNNEIHDNVTADTLDCHGVQASAGGKKIWVLDNHIYNNGGDGIQACHQCNPGPRYLYIGRNNFHGDKENGIDLKYASDVIISQNKLHDYLLPVETGDVSPIVVGSDGAPSRVWILFNEIYDCRKGIRIEETDSIWIIGNLIYNIEGAGIIPEKKGIETRIVNNTLYNMKTGISEPWRERFNFFIYNNIFAHVNDKSINIGSIITEQPDISNNLFWEASSHGNNPIDQDPEFTDASNHNFSLLPTSPAIDVAVVREGIFQDFYTLYGIDIRKAIDGATRPQGNGWDIGAYEFATDSSKVKN